MSEQSTQVAERAAISDDGDYLCDDEEQAARESLLWPDSTPANWRSKYGTRRCYLDSRTQRGLLWYESCSENELLSFACQRDLLPKCTITSPHYLAPTKTELFSILERADETPEFSSFLRLPIELRMMIYHFHLDSLPQVGATARSPPLTRASSQLRREVLPLWYANQTLEVPLHIRCEYILDHKNERQVQYIRDIPLGTKNGIVLYPALGSRIRRTQAFFEHAADDTLAMIQSIHVNVRLRVTCCPLGAPACRVADVLECHLTFSLDGKRQDYGLRSWTTVRMKGRVKSRRQEVHDAAWDMNDLMADNFHAMLQGMRERAGGMRLRRRDLDAFQEIVRLGIW